MYIIPILTYAGEAWAPFISTSTWRKIEAVQTIDIRVILGQPSIVKNSVLLHTTGFVTVKHLIKKNALATFHRISTSQYNHIKNIGLISHPSHASRHKQRPRVKLWQQVNHSDNLDW